MKREALLLLIVAASPTVSTGSDLLNLELRSAGLSLESDELKILLPRGRVKGKSVANRLSAHAKLVASNLPSEEAINNPAKTAPSIQSGRSTSSVSAKGAATRQTKTSPSVKGNEQSPSSSSKYFSLPSSESSKDGAQDLLHAYLRQHSSQREQVDRSPPSGAPVGNFSKPPPRSGTPAGGPSRQPPKEPEVRQQRTAPRHGGMPNRASRGPPHSTQPRYAGLDRHMMSERLGELLQVPPGPVYIPRDDTSRWSSSGHEVARQESFHPYIAGNSRAHTVTDHVPRPNFHHSMVAPQYGQGHTSMQAPSQFPQHSPMPIQAPPYFPQHNPMSSHGAHPEMQLRLFHPLEMQELTYNQRLAMDPANTERLLGMVKEASNKNIVAHAARRVGLTAPVVGWGGMQLSQRLPGAESRSNVRDLWSDSMELGQHGFPNLLDPNRPHGMVGNAGTGANPRYSPRHVNFKRDLDGVTQQQSGSSSPLSIRATPNNAEETITKPSSRSPSPAGKRNKIHTVSSSTKLQGQAVKTTHEKAVRVGGPSGMAHGPPLSIEEKLRIVAGPSCSASPQQKDSPSQSKNPSAEQFNNLVKSRLSSVGSNPSLMRSLHSSTNNLALEKPKQPTTPHPLLASLPASIDGSVSPPPE